MPSLRKITEEMILTPAQGETHAPARDGTGCLRLQQAMVIFASEPTLFCRPMHHLPVEDGASEVAWRAINRIYGWWLNILNAICACVALSCPSRAEFENESFRGRNTLTFNIGRLQPESADYPAYIMPLHITFTDG